MKAIRLFGVLFAAVTLVGLAAEPTFAANPKFELGTSLVSGTIGLGDNDFKLFGVPSSGFGIINPSVYGSIFVGDKLAIEPQLGLAWFSFGDGDSNHLLSLGGQVDYFLNGTTDASPYLFGSVGLIDISDFDETVKSFGGGVGYRIPVGDNLTFRVDGRFVHFTDDGGDAITVGLSIGGLFGQK